MKLTETPKIILKVDGHLEPQEVVTEWVTTTTYNQYGRVLRTFITPGENITKIFGVVLAKQVIGVLQEKVDFYESDYFKWGQRKSGGK